MKVFERLDSINPVGLENSKFHNLNGLEADSLNKKHSLPENRTDDKLVVVAHVWDDLRYAKYLYLSLISAYRFTDIQNFDIKLFFSQSLREHGEDLKRIFSPFTSSINFKQKRFKYFTSFYEEINDYEFVAHLDSDLFFCGKRKPFFENLKNFYLSYRKQNFPGPYVCFNLYPYRTSEFRVCDHLENQLDLESYEAVKNWIVDTSPMKIQKDDLNNWIRKERWPWNVFYSYDLKAFSRKSFSKLIDWWYSETKEWWEEEKVYWFWMNYTDFPYFPLNRVSAKNTLAINPYYFEEKIPEGLTKDDYMELNKLKVRKTLKDISWKNDSCLYMVHPFEYHEDLIGENEVTKNFLKFIIKQRKKI